MYSRKVNCTPHDLRSLSSITIRLEQWPIRIPDIKKKRKEKKERKKERKNKGKRNTEESGLKTTNYGW